MTLELVKDWLFWCMALNVAVLALSALVIWLAKGFYGPLHQSIFGLPQEQVNVAHYKYIVYSKMLIIIFNVVPYCALLLIG